MKPIPSIPLHYNFTYVYTTLSPYENVTPVSVLHVIQTQRLGYTFGWQLIKILKLKNVILENEQDHVEALLGAQRVY